MGRLLSLFLLVAAILGFWLSAYTVDEGKRGLIVHLGGLNRGDDGKVSVYEPGLHFRMPVVDSVVIIDSRIQTIDEHEDRIVTKEKKDVIVDSYIKWRVSDYEQFYVRNSGGQFWAAESLLKNKANNALQREFGLRTIREVVSGERDQLMEELRESLNSEAQQLGIDVVDFRVKKINLPESVSHNVYERMRSERKRVATGHRSKGREQAEVIRAEADRLVQVILAEADKEAKTIRGEGDAEAAAIYANAYSKDPEFFAFFRSMQAYRESFKNKEDLMVLKPDSEFFQYMKQAK